MQGDSATRECVNRRLRFMGDTISLHPKGITIDTIEGKSLLEIFQEKDIYVKSSCGGFARCRDCVIKILDGAENLNDPTFEEKQLIGNVFHITRERLSCQTRTHGCISVDLSGHNPDSDKTSSKKRFKVRKKKEIVPKEDKPKSHQKKRSNRRPKPFLTD